MTLRCAWLAGLLALSGCASEPPGPPAPQWVLPAADYPGESAALRQRLAGSLVALRPVGGVWTVDLATGRQQWLRDRGRGAALHDLSAPDALGRVVVLAHAQPGRRYALRLVGPGSDVLLREGPGEPLWDQPVSGLALDASGQRLAFVRQPVEGESYKRLNVGPLWVLALADGQARQVAADALGERPAWLPDGKRLVYSAPGPDSPEKFRQLPPAAQPDPQVRILHVEEGSSRRLTSGRSPIVSSDGQVVLVTRRAGEPGEQGGQGDQLFWVPLDGGAERPLQRPPGLVGPVALLDSRYLLYTARPTPGAPTGQTSNNSPLVGPKSLLALKAMDLRTRESVTLFDGVDPRTRITAGHAAAGR